MLDDILVGDNVRDIDSEHVENLAQSIALRGLLVPLIVRPTSAGYELVAGYQRYDACRKLNLTDVPVVVRDREGSSAEHAAEKARTPDTAGTTTSARRSQQMHRASGSGRSSRDR